MGVVYVVEVRVNSYEYYLDIYNDDVSLIIDAIIDIDGKKFKVVVEADREEIVDGNVISAVRGIANIADYKVKWYMEEVVHELARRLSVLNKVKVTDELLLEMVIQIIRETAKKHVDNPYYSVMRIFEEREE